MPDRGEDKPAMALDEEIPGAVEVFRLELGDPITHASTPPGMARIYGRALGCQGKGNRRRDFRRGWLRPTPSTSKIRYVRATTISAAIGAAALILSARS